jgi:hypothetical protein
LGGTESLAHAMTILPDRQTLASTVDRLSVRIGLAVVVGLPAAAFAFAYGYWGLIVGLGGLSQGTYPFLSAALLAITTLGLLGILGGWIRLLRRQSTMTELVRRVTVALLWCGVVAAVCLAASMLLREAHPLSLLSATVWTVMSVIGMVLIHATPARDTGGNRKSLQGAAA